MNRLRVGSLRVFPAHAGMNRRCPSRRRWEQLDAGLMAIMKAGRDRRAVARHHPCR
jgi:hypothetical protein